MAIIEVITFIKSSPEIVFDLSRSIDLHKLSTAKTKEEAVAGVTKGLIGMNETVTWQAYHLFKKRRFTSKITAYDFPFSFTDEMQEGDLKFFSHLHSFEKKDERVIMTDKITLEAPFGFLGKLVMSLFLKNYFKHFLIERNKMIKDFAETDQWKQVLKNYN
jgi:ligand-binding SRPBCC domain-containing protein